MYIPGSDVVVVPDKFRSVEPGTEGVCAAYHRHDSCQLAASRSFLPKRVMTRERIAIYKGKGAEDCIRSPYAIRHTFRLHELLSLVGTQGVDIQALS